MADQCRIEQLSTVIWPGPPNEFSGPSRYTRETVSQIPTGSLYFASRKGPFSEMNARITGSPYDMIGIIVWSEAPGREGTYVYTMDPNSGVVVISLETLIVDDSIIHHAILPLKDLANDEWTDQRHEILKGLFRKYRSLAPQYDPYQSLASIIGLPVADSLRVKNTLTPAELVGLILFQAGVIWDQRNPIYSWDDCFFNQEEDGAVALITPALYRERPSQAPQSPSSESSSSSESTPPIRMKIVDPPKSEEKTPIKIKVADSSSSDSLNNIINEGQRKSRQKKKSNSSQDFDDIMREDLRGYLQSSLRREPPPREEKWKEEKGEDWSEESDLDEPVKKAVISRTIIFGSLRPDDFLVSYYVDLDSKQSIRRIRSPSSRRGPHSELMAVVESLADQGISDINHLDMSWYHDNLVPIDLLNRPESLCQREVDEEVQNLRLVLCQLDQDFIQRRALHLENSLLSNERLLRICRQTSELAAELHSLSGQCQTHVRTSTELKPLESWDQEKSYLHFSIKLSSEGGGKQLMILPRYMWGQDWKYDWRSRVKFTAGKFSELFSQLEKLRIRFIDLRNRIPLSCVIVELVAHLQENTQHLHRYLQSCHRH